MLGHFHLPPKQGLIETKCYYGSANTMQVWTKPPGASFVWLFLHGAGAGGGGGQSGASTSTRRGGGGGGSGNIQQLLIPACFIPDTLYINLTPGGVGGGTDANGSTTGLSGIHIAPLDNETTGRLLCAMSGQTGKNGTSGGAGGGTQTTTTLSNLCMATRGIYINLNSNGGAAAAANANGVNAASMSTVGGTGSGGGSANTTRAWQGGFSTGYSSYWAFSGGNSSGGDGSGPITFGGPDNITLDMHFCIGGGTGGGGSQSGQGGRGGNGGPGSGGGGGGAGVTGGAGGDGGPAFAIIACW